MKQLIMKAKDELGPCWVESQSSVTNHGKDIIEEIIDIRAAPDTFSAMLQPNWHSRETFGIK